MTTRVNEPARRYRALLIGNGEFPRDTELSRLHGPAVDLPHLRDALKDTVTGLPWEVTEVLDGTSEQILEAMTAFFDRATRHDQLLLYYSGHGLTHQANGLLYLCAHNTRTANLRGTAVRHSDINDLVEGCGARTIVIVLDCCFSGTAAVKGGGVPADKFAGRGRYVMTSCGPGQPSADATARGEPSPYTAHFVRGLRCGAVAANGFVTVAALYDYVYECLDGTGQQPLMRADDRLGHVPMARRPMAEPERTALRRRMADSVGAEAALDLRPVLTTPHGLRVHPRAESHFSGVLHIRLRDSLGVFSVHRDDLIDAGRGEERPAWLARDSVMGSWRPSTLTSTTTPDGDVLFTLPGDGGTLLWTAGQLKDFEETRALGGWPEARWPIQHAATRAVLRSRDPVFRSITRVGGCVTACLLTICGEGLSIARLVITALHGTASGLAALGVIVFALLTLVVCPWTVRKVWISRRISALLQLPTLPVTPMLMKAVIERPTAPPVILPHSHTATPPAEEFLVLSCEGTRIKMPLDFHSKQFRKGHPPFDIKEPQPVEIVGLPAKGEWIAVRTPHGMLWPSGRVQQAV
jgi:hypothetical protein